MPKPEIANLAPEYIGQRIAWLRGEKVILDVDLARLYGVSTTRLNEQVKAERWTISRGLRIPTY